MVGAVIPTRDRPDSLERALASCFGQTYQPVEILVVDDGSRPPASVADHAGVRVLRHDEALGRARARNVGVHASRADLIAFLDDDDAWRPQAVERLVSALLAGGPHTVAAGAGFDLWAGDRLVRRHLPPRRSSTGHALLEQPVFAPSAMLVRREALVSAGGFDERLERCEDWSLWLRLLEQGKIVAVHEVLADRCAGPPAPLRDLSAMQRFERLVVEPALASLPHARRRRVRHRHRLAHGVLTAQAGQRWRAARLLLGAWSAQPTASKQLGRVAIGERAWERLRTVRWRWRQARLAGVAPSRPFD